MGQPRRPDQSYDPPGNAAPVSSQAGILRGRLVIVSGPSGAVVGVFVYAAGTTPALGNPPIASMTNSTLDPFGNAVEAGITSYQAGTTIFTQLLNGMITYQDASLSPIDWTAGAVSISGTGYLKLGQQGLASPLYMNQSGTILGSHPASTTPETWQTVTVFGTNFAAGAPAPRYRLEPMGSAGVVRLAGVVSVTGATLAAATMFTLAAGYHPLFTQSFVTTNSTGTVAAGSVSITAAGVVQCAPASANGDAVFLDGITFPLD